MATATRPVGDIFREWRQRRCISQLDLALKADVSARHLSFVETGRSQPSREMVMHLAEQLDIPLRERNGLLLAAGYAPAFSERPLDDPALDGARRAVERVLTGHEPYPALAVDRHWTMVAANRVVGPMLAGAAPALLRPPVNVLRLSLHPEGVAPRIANFREWRAHLLSRLQRQIDVSGDQVLVELIEELRGYTGPAELEPATHGPAPHDPDVAVPLRLRGPAGTLDFLSTTTVFGTPLEITLSELAIEAFFPADAATAAFLRDLAEARLSGRDCSQLGPGRGGSEDASQIRAEWPSD